MYVEVSLRCAWAPRRRSSSRRVKPRLSPPGRQRIESHREKGFTGAFCSWRWVRLCGGVDPCGPENGRTRPGRAGQASTSMVCGETAPANAEGVGAPRRGHHESVRHAKPPVTRPSDEADRKQADAAESERRQDADARRARTGRDGRRRRVLHRHDGRQRRGLGLRGRRGFRGGRRRRGHRRRPRRRSAHRPRTRTSPSTPWPMTTCDRGSTRPPRRSTRWCWSPRPCCSTRRSTAKPKKAAYPSRRE